MTRSFAAALVCLALAAGCSSDGSDDAGPSPSPSVTASPDPFAPTSRADLAARIQKELPAIRDVKPEQTDAYYALSTACLNVSRTERATTDAVATAIGLTAAIRTDLRAAADSCGTHPTEASVTLRRVVAALA